MIIEFLEEIAAILLASTATTVLLISVAFLISYAVTGCTNRIKTSSSAFKALSLIVDITLHIFFGNNLFASITTTSIFKHLFHIVSFIDVEYGNNGLIIGKLPEKDEAWSGLKGIGIMIADSSIIVLPLFTIFLLIQALLSSQITFLGQQLTLLSAQLHTVTN